MVRSIVQKSRPSSNLVVKGQRLRSPGTKKNTKKCGIFRASSSWDRSSGGAFRGRGYAGGKISAYCLVLPTLSYKTHRMWLKSRVYLDFSGSERLIATIPRVNDHPHRRQASNADNSSVCLSVRLFVHLPLISPALSACVRVV